MPEPELWTTDAEGRIVVIPSKGPDRRIVIVTLRDDGSADVHMRPDLTLEDWNLAVDRLGRLAAALKQEASRIARL